MTAITSSIPAEAEERIEKWYPDGSKKAAKYLVNGKVVGIRAFTETGAVFLEATVSNGVPHGPYTTWHENGQVSWATQLVEGRGHGTSRQWAMDGTLVGEYQMDHGTGLDLWWTDVGKGYWSLSEARYMQSGQRHGFEWWLSGPTTIGRESHFWEDKEHGIFRDWNSVGRLRRGFPQYWVHGQRVKKRQYLRAAERDATLPKFREADNRPKRKFPAEVEAAQRRNLKTKVRR